MPRPCLVSDSSTASSSELSVPSANGLISKKPAAAISEERAATPALTLGLTGQKYVFTHDRTVLSAMMSASEGHVLPCVRDAATLRQFITAAKKLVAAVSHFMVKSKRKKASSDKRKCDKSYYADFLVRKLLLHELAHGSEARSIDWSTVTLQDLKSLSPDQTGVLDTIPEDWSAEAVSNLFHGRSDWGVFVSAYSCLLHELCERDMGVHCRIFYMFFFSCL